MTVARDLACSTRLDTTRNVSGIELRTNALIRRVTTKRGSLYFHRGYGIDVRDLLGAGTEPGQMRGYEAQLRSECEACPYIVGESVRVSLVESVGPDGSTIQISISADSEDGDVAFVMTIDKVTLSILGIKKGVA
jgi:hypothetical protein